MNSLIKKEKNILKVDIISILLMGLAILLEVFLLTYEPVDSSSEIRGLGFVSTWVAFGMFQAFGIIAYFLPLTLFFFALKPYILSNTKYQLSGLKICLLVLLFLCILTLANLIYSGNIAYIKAPGLGGWFGGKLCENIICKLVNDIAAFFVVFGLIFLSIIVIFDIKFSTVLNLIWKFTKFAGICLFNILKYLGKFIGICLVFIFKKIFSKNQKESATEIIIDDKTAAKEGTPRVWIQDTKSDNKIEIVIPGNQKQPKSPRPEPPKPEPPKLPRLEPPIPEPPPLRGDPPPPMGGRWFMW